MQKTSKAYSFTKYPRGRKLSSEINDSPGPGAYYPSNYTFRNPKSFK